uniref:Putative group i salivary lipocalin n=1 Tax=Rhipicephalus pulchellus TaxID=72859 RepID=L7LQI6_RHIPC
MLKATSILALVIVVSALQERNHGKANYDLAKFMEQNEKIWTLKSSDVGKWKCKLDHSIKITGKDAVLNRSYVVKKKVSSFIVTGRLGSSREDDTYNRMILYDSSGYFIGYEDILFSNTNNTCAVINVTVDSKYDYDDPTPSSTTWGDSEYSTRFEIRISDSLLEGPRSACKEQFRKYANGSEGRPVSTKRGNCRKYYRQSETH